MLLALSLLALAPLLVPPCIARSQETYSESLRLTPLADGKVHSNLSFSMAGPWNDEQQVGKSATAQHHTHLPSALTSLLTHHRISSFHLTLSSGRWSPHWPTTSSPASGIELVAWLEPDEEEDELAEAKRWHEFTGGLGGLFCTGVTQGGNEASRPDWGYSYEGEGAEGETLRPYRLVLPRLSATCTESLTPFLSLLPCSSRAGLGALLNPHRLFDGEWTLLGVHFEQKGGMGEVRLEVGSVQDPVRRDRLAGGLGRRDFSLESLFDRQLTVACPVAETSTVKLVVPRNSVNAFEIQPSDGRVVEKEGELEIVKWETKQGSPTEPLNARISWPTENPFRYPHVSRLPTPPISTRRILLGRGQERGHIGIELINNGAEAAEVLWVEEWPWWVRGFVGSLTAEGASSSEDSQPSVLALDYTPPIPRRRPTTLQALLHLPPRSTSKFLLPYESSYLWYTEYPSDAHRGFEVPGALVILLNPASPSAEEIDVDPSHLLASRGAKLRLHTPSTLLSLPTPDFSMPYNVIILTSTVVALFFGSVCNKLVRAWWVVDLEAREEAEKKEDKKE
ncbi:GPI transamidase component PIG-T [Leucosporidium creatinivorum]|uniref:GPI transamidase component PIG-T n=1 Tax=Leucosporidium creatinivorum TaxID=106004 RepID=A0A1Y2F138_9BASI|nr:GPI transamidase component PIG-T [Leucosporidium creatinivorum]